MNFRNIIMQWKMELNSSVGSCFGTKAEFCCWMKQFSHSGPTKEVSSTVIIKQSSFREWNSELYCQLHWNVFRDYQNPIVIVCECVCDRECMNMSVCLCILRCWVHLCYLLHNKLNPIWGPYFGRRQRAKEKKAASNRVHVNNKCDTINMGV